MHVPTLPQALAPNYTNLLVWRWGRGMLGTQRASSGNGELHTDSPLQPVLRRRRSEFLTKQRNGGQEKLIGSGAGCNDAESAVHKLKYAYHDDDDDEQGQTRSSAPPSGLRKNNPLCLLAAFHQIGQYGIASQAENSRGHKGTNGLAAGLATWNDLGMAQPKHQGSSKGM
jgi:hypothetical protein